MEELPKCHACDGTGWAIPRETECRKCLGSGIMLSLQAVTDHKAFDQLCLNDCFDSYDLWGSVMGVAFACCDYMIFVLNESVPAELQYRPSPLGADTASLEFWMMEEFYPNSGLTPGDLFEFLRLINVALDDLKAAGKDY